MRISERTLNAVARCLHSEVPVTVAAVARLLNLTVKNALDALDTLVEEGRAHRRADANYYAGPGEG